ncbi:tRNA pseudouridine synthase [Aspergillus luchuensis]|uniref:tRNA pseudouridine synthase n=1 Tax=Aspergillus kawachii TaxID=1069201 RepID=A0A146F5S7_ASPKA|nr:tRNA pseudouridine synthase [Aspergillus luchuensis]
MNEAAEEEPSSTSEADRRKIFGGEDQAAPTQSVQVSQPRTPIFCSLRQSSTD